MATGLTFAPALLLALTLIAVIVLRTRPVAIKLGTELVLLLLIGGFLMTRGLNPLPNSSDLAGHSDAALLRAVAVVWWLVAARMIATLTAFGLGHDARSKQARLFSDLLAGGIYLTAVLIILNSVLGLPINGLLATSGVIAIVLGLALQNTLADVFSGIAVGIEQPFHVGDRITLADLAEGVVVEMNWRSVRIETDGEDTATIPNSVVAKSQIINRSVPTEQRAAMVDIPAPARVSAEHLIRLISQATLLCTGLLESPPPKVFLKYAGIRTTTFSVSYFVASTAGLMSARSEVLRQVRRIFYHAGVDHGTPPSDTELLRDLALFDSLDDDQLGTLATALMARTLEPGETLFEQGSAGAELYIIKSGILEISRRAGSGDLQVYGKIGPGEYLGEVGMMSGEPRPISVIALSQASVVALPKTGLEVLLRSSPELSAAMERSVRRGLALLNRDSAARNCEPLDHHGNLLSRIKAFLGRAVP